MSCLFSDPKKIIFSQSRNNFWGKSTFDFQLFNFHVTSKFFGTSFTPPKCFLLKFDHLGPRHKCHVISNENGADRLIFKSSVEWYHSHFRPRHQPNLTRTPSEGKIPPYTPKHFCKCEWSKHLLSTLFWSKWFLHAGDKLVLAGVDYDPNECIGPRLDQTTQNNHGRVNMNTYQYIGSRLSKLRNNDNLY